MVLWQSQIRIRSLELLKSRTECCPNFDIHFGGWVTAGMLPKFWYPCTIQTQGECCPNFDIHCKRFAQSAGLGYENCLYTRFPSVQVAQTVPCTQFFGSFVWEFWSTLCTNCPLWELFWSYFCTLGVMLGALWLHFLYQEIDWGAKGAPGAPLGAHPRNKVTFLEPFWGQFFDIFEKNESFGRCFFLVLFRSPFLWFLVFFLCPEPWKYSKNTVGLFKIKGPKKT